MAAAQIRNVPEDVHQRYRRRAAAAGMSPQEDLLAQLTEPARFKTPAEIVAEVEEEMRRDPEGWSSGSSTDDLRADRDTRRFLGFRRRTWELRDDVTGYDARLAWADGPRCESGLLGEE